MYRHHKKQNWFGKRKLSQRNQAALATLQRGAIQESTMKFVARFIAIVVVAIVMAPAQYAQGGTQPATMPQNGEPSSSSVTSVITITALPAGAAHNPKATESSVPLIEWSAGYSFWRAMPTSPSNRMSYLHGGNTSVAYNFNRYLGVVADFGGFDNNRLTLFTPTSSRTVSSSGSAFTYLFGPRLSYRRHRSFTPFAEALFGAATASAVTVSGCTGSPTCTPLESETAFAAMFGAGLDIRIFRHVAFRLFEGDFLLTHFTDPFSAGGINAGWQRNVRVSTGIVFRFGE
jgi:hypothetical protein